MKRSLKQRLKSFGVWMLIVNLAFVGLPTLAMAGDFGTDAFISSEQSDGTVARQRAEALLAEPAVMQQMQAMGVDYDDVVERVAALSNEELMALDGQLDELPAGASVLGVIGVVFVVLLILELVGVTNIFTAV
ncbi:MAG: PA2779 family protein [Gammaproteobacteria bacterium]|nr:PA2779 family protein [Gammaproteobacteria bacterium]